MSLSTQTNRTDHTENGVTTVFPFDFKIFNEADLVVISVDHATLAETTLSLGTDYTVSGVNAESGSITKAAGTSGDGLVIKRVVDLTQPTVLRNQSDFFPATHERAFDRIVMQIQQQQEELDRVVKFSPTSTSRGVMPEPVPGYAVGFDANGDLAAVPNTGVDQTNAWTAADALIRSDLAATTGAEMVGYLAPYTGAVATNQNAFNNAGSINAVLHFGLHPSNSEAANTTALNAAVAAAIANGRSLYIPGAGVANPYQLNALDPITSGVTICGDGKATLLQFNTTGDCIHISPGVSEQRENYTLRDLNFKSVTDVPSAFIANDYGLNLLIDRCYFNDTSATYCIDQRTGYGTTIRGCVFSDITGTAIRLRDNGAAPLYSYVTKIEDCDITRMSADGVEIEGTGTGPVSIYGTAIEACGGIGVRCNTKAGGGFTWNLGIYGCYFELNAGYDISLNGNGSTTLSSAIVSHTQFSGTPTIDLGGYAKIQIDSCTNSGGNVCVVSGSANAKATLHNSLNFSQSGSFVWVDDANDTGLVSYTPVWGSSGTQPVIGNGTITGKYKRIGNQVTVHIRIVAGSTTTFGTGNYYVSLPIAAAESGQVARVVLLRTGNAYWTGWFNTISGSVNHTLQTSSGGATNAATNVTNTSPATWAVNDTFDIDLTYWV